jgi:hypothetical protein
VSVFVRMSRMDLRHCFLHSFLLVAGQFQKWSRSSMGHLRNAGRIICLPGIVVMSPAGTLLISKECVCLPKNESKECLQRYQTFDS